MSHLAHVTALTRMLLRFDSLRLEKTEFYTGSGPYPLRTSTAGGPRYTKIQWCGQLKAVAIFLLEQAAWFLADPERAKQEIELAVRYGQSVPETAPVFVGPAGSAAATLAEGLRKQHSAALEAVFGDWLFIRDTFPHRISPPSVCLDVRKLSPANIEVIIDGERAVDPQALLELARRIEERRMPRWLPRTGK
jgi:hypothetical protein